MSDAPPVRPAPPGKTIPGAPAHLSDPPLSDDEVAAPDAGGDVGGKPLKKWPFIMAGVLVVLVAIGAVAYGPIVRSVTVSQARALGVELEVIGDVSLGWGEVTVDDYTFAFEDVEGVSGRGKSLTVDIDFLTPTSMEANEVELDLVGSAAVLAVAFSEWTGKHPELVRIPTEAKDVSVSWRESDKGPVWLKLRGGTIEPMKNGAKLAADRTSVFGLPVGGVGAVWKGDEATAKLGFGRSDEDEAPILIEVENLKSKPKAKIALRKTSLMKLSGPLGMLLPIQGVMVSGDAELRYKGKRKAPIVGKVSGELDGYSPPLPKEARGFKFSDVTKMSTEVEISPDRDKVTFRKMKVKNGALEMTGEGSIERGKSYAVIHMSLDGRVSCAALAKAALASGMGARLGPMAEAMAAGGVKGSVEIKLRVEADTRSLLSTKVVPEIGVGCGIRWPDLPELPDSIPKIPGLPSLPGFPGAPD